MHKVHYTLRERLRPYVNCIMTDRSTDPHGALHLPLYADGYPGLMFQQSARGLYLLPRQKRLSELFLYGQTVQPVALSAEGSYRFVVFQLYPFASQYLLHVDPRKLNDDCYDLLQRSDVGASAFLQRLQAAEEVTEHIEIMSDLVEALLDVHEAPADDRLQQAIGYIIRANRQVRIREVQDTACLTERTLERQFLSQVGLTPKQFARIIQFQSTLERIEAADNLTEVGLDSGFADQSHFIRVFKAYTGLSPLQYRRRVTAHPG